MPRLFRRSAQPRSVDATSPAALAAEAAAELHRVAEELGGTVASATPPPSSPPDDPAARPSAPVSRRARKNPPTRGAGTGRT